MITISYAITVKDELEEIKRLLDTLKNYVTDNDEVVILYDQSNGSEDVISYLRTLNDFKNLKYHKDIFKNNFSEWKNKLTQLCSKEYIFQIDADEVPNETLLENLSDILSSNNIDVYLVPRVNTVEGITEEHINKWGWKVNSKGWINWPDLQWRIYKNDGKIKWVNKVHETLVGFKTYSTLPSYEELSLFHPKDIKRQVKQNEFYSKI